MPYLKLTDRHTAKVFEFEVSEVKIGRAPDCEIVPMGKGTEVVSGYHVRFIEKDGVWFVEDLGSRNGTFMDDVPVPGHVPRPAAVGKIVRLGERGPRYSIDAVQKIEFDETIQEAPLISRPEDPTLPLSAYGATEPFDASEMPEPPKPPKSTEPESIEPVKPRHEMVPPSPAPPPSIRSQPTKPREPEKAAGYRSKPEPEHTPGPRTKPTDARRPEPKVAETKGAGIRVVLVETRSGERWEATGGRIRLGRGKECELRPIGPSDTSVSRVHAEILVKQDQRVVIRDAQSRNGTFLNGKMVVGERELKSGDTVELGDQGPNLSVETMEVVGASGAQPKIEASKGKTQRPSWGRRRAKKADRALEKMDPPRRSFGGLGATVFFKEMFRDTQVKSARRVRIIAWSAVSLLVVTVGVVYWWSERRVRLAATQFGLQHQAAVAAIADSISQSAAADYQRLRQELQAATAGSAPAATVESLRVALNAAQERTSALEAALERAQNSMAEQLAAGDSIQRAAQAELSRLQGELDRASSAGTSGLLLDSLRRALEDAEQRSAQINTQLRAVRRVDLPAVAQANQGAIGLVTAFIEGGIFDGTGFVLTPSGYMVTNRHVVSRNDVVADSVYVTMADQQNPRRGSVVMVASIGGPDLAVIRIHDYDGLSVPNVDWSGNNVRQGASAALIGFPAGLGNAMDRTMTVRTLMAAGIFSRVTADVINFDGFTTGGSSGSPIFNASGEVVAVHRAGLREATGLSFAVPITKLVPMLPAEARRELGLQ